MRHICEIKLEYVIDQRRERRGEGDGGERKLDVWEASDIPCMGIQRLPKGDNGRIGEPLRLGCISMNAPSITNIKKRRRVSIFIKKNHGQEAH